MKPSQLKSSFSHAPQPSPLHHTKIKMAALSAVAPIVAKVATVSTGKAANTNAMMVWQPHNNK
jgi:hypothetical protein